MVDVVNWVVLIIVMATSTGLLLIHNWRWSLGLLAVQYLGVFWMIQSHWPIAMATTKLIMGWMACAVIGIAHLNREGPLAYSSHGQRRLSFQVLTTGMVIAVTFAASFRLVDWLGLSFPITWAGLMIMGLGLLHLGVTSETFQIILGLLTLLAGFDIIYTAVESSALVTALMVVINLGLALAGAYYSNREETA